MPKLKSQFVCQACGFSAVKWLGRCTECGEYGTLVEESLSSAQPAGALSSARPTSISEVRTDDFAAPADRLGELDRVLGGGLVPGSRGAARRRPGHRQVDAAAAGARRLSRARAEPVLYVSGEESAQQIALRAERLGARGARAAACCAETELEKILDAAPSAESRRCWSVDSIQTMYPRELDVGAGLASAQVRECAAQLMRLRQDQRHRRSSSSATSPRTAPSPGRGCSSTWSTPCSTSRATRTHAFASCARIKNRFGSTNEIGVFEMTRAGPGRGAPTRRRSSSPSGRRARRARSWSRHARGHAAAAGRDAGAGRARRLRRRAPDRDRPRPQPGRAAARGAASSSAGIDVARPGRVRERRRRRAHSSEPAADLAVLRGDRLEPARKPRARRAHARASARSAWPARCARSAAPSARLREAAKLGFRRCILPELTRSRLAGPTELELIGVRDVSTALDALIA